MGKKHHTTVNLPQLTPYIELPDHLAIPLQLIIDAGESGINTLQLQAAGIIGCAGTIYSLSNRGAHIDTELKNVIDSNGRTRKRVAHYIYRGWGSAPVVENGGKRG